MRVASKVQLSFLPPPRYALILNVLQNGFSRHIPFYPDSYEVLRVIFIPQVFAASWTRSKERLCWIWKCRLAATETISLGCV